LSGWGVVSLLYLLACALQYRYLNNTATAALHIRQQQQNACSTTQLCLLQHTLAAARYTCIHLYVHIQQQHQTRLPCPNRTLGHSASRLPFLTALIIMLCSR
jgi:hypothetical protein